METIIKKIPMSAEIADAFMNSIRQNCGELFEDKEFCKRFAALQDCIDEQYKDMLETTIIANYAVYEQLPPETEHAEKSSD